MRRPASTGSASGSSSSATGCARRSSRRAASARRLPFRSCPRSCPLPLLPRPRHRPGARGRAAALARGSRAVRADGDPLLHRPGRPRDRGRGACARSRARRSGSASGWPLEPFQLEGIESWSILNTLGDAAAFIDEVGSDAVGIQFDVWHLWNTPDLLDEIPRHAHLIAGVHVSDWREPTRGWADRVLPGDGAADLPRSSAS